MKRDFWLTRTLRLIMNPPSLYEFDEEDGDE